MPYAFFQAVEIACIDCSCNSLYNLGSYILYLSKVAIEENVVTSARSTIEYMRIFVGSTARRLERVLIHQSLR